MSRGQKIARLRVVQLMRGDDEELPMLTKEEHAAADYPFGSASKVDAAMADEWEEIIDWLLQGVGVEAWEIPDDVAVLADLAEAVS